MLARAAVLTACLLATWAFLARASRAEPTPIREPLASLSLQVADWRGRSEPPFEAKILRVLGVDDYIVRSYGRPGGLPVGLYVGYHDSQRQGDTIHSPLNCLPGAGWVPVEQGRRTLAVRNGAQGPARDIEVNKVVIQKGLDRQVVIYWYQSHGRVVASEYWGKVYTVVDAIRLNRTDAAMVRVIVPVRGEGAGGVSAAETEAMSFTGAVFPLLGQHLPS